MRCLNQAYLKSLETNVEHVILEASAMQLNIAVCHMRLLQLKEKDISAMMVLVLYLKGKLNHGNPRAIHH